MSDKIIDSNMLYHNFALEFLDILPLAGVRRVLDAGCGVGYQSKWFVDNGIPEVKSLDYEQRTIFEDLDFVEADIINAPFDDGYFDAVWSHHVIEHVSNPVLYLIKLRRLLNPTGQLWITVPQIDSVISSGHINSYTMSMLIYHLAIAGFNCKSGKFIKQRSHLRAMVSPSALYSPMSFEDADLTLVGLSEKDLFPDEIKRILVETGRVDDSTVDLSKL